MTDKEKDDNLNRLANAIEKVVLKPHHLVWRSFLAGLASGLGATVGVTIILAVLGIVVRQFGGVPVIGQVFQDLGEVLTKVRH